MSKEIKMMTLLHLFFAFCIILPKKAATGDILSMGVEEKTWVDAISACEKKNETMFSLDNQNCTVIGQFPKSPSSDFVWTDEYISTEHLSVYTPLTQKPPIDCWAIRRTQEEKVNFYAEKCSSRYKYACRSRKEKKDICLESQYISLDGRLKSYRIGIKAKLINITITMGNNNCKGNYFFENSFFWVTNWCKGTFVICYTEEMNVALMEGQVSWSDAASDCAAIKDAYLVDEKAVRYVDPYIFPYYKYVWIGAYRIWKHIEDSHLKDTPARCLACLRTGRGWESTEENCYRSGGFICQREEILEMTTETTTITQQTITFDSHVSSRDFNEFSDTDDQNSTNDDFNTAYIIIGVMVPVGIICIIVLVVVLKRNRKKSKREREEASVSFHHGQAMDCALGGGTTKGKQLTTEHGTDNQHCLQVDSTHSAIPSPVYNVPVDATNNYDVIPAEREPESTSCSESRLPPSPFYNLPDDNINENVYNEVEDDKRSQHKRSKPCKEPPPPSPFYSNVDSKNRLAVPCKGQSPPSPIYNNVEDANDNVYYSRINKNNRSLPNASLSLAQKCEPSNENERNVTCYVPQSSYENCEGVSQTHSADDYNRLNEVTKPKMGNVNPYDHLFFSDDSYDKVQFKPSADHADSYGYSKWE